MKNRIYSLESINFKKEMKKFSHSSQELQEVEV